MEDKNPDAMSGKTDERKKGNWESRYTDDKAIKYQKREAVYLFVMVVLSFTILVINYNGCIQQFLCIPADQYAYFSRIVTCSICGLLGGTIFDIKWFYKSIAHGFWNLDRVYWRFFTPIISLSFAFCLSCIFKENIIIHGDGFSAVTLGFLAGYFSDEAVGKMAEVAKLLFSTNSKPEEKTNAIDNPEEKK